MPERLDLQRCGWILDPDGQPSSDCVGLIDAAELDSVEWMRLLSSLHQEVRRCVLIVGVQEARERTSLLEIGFGDVVTDRICIEELGARANRLVQFTQWLPRSRRIGRLTLDLLAREAFGDGKPLNLNPREFALIWRLADSLDQFVSKQELIYDVWRMGFVPETNSVAVHMSRLRRKLAFVGLAGVIETSPSGGYRLRVPDGCPVDEASAQTEGAPKSVKVRAVAH
ncbi:MULTISPECIES: winged helix-turn-helix domain-containing protein [Novosphingobium]|uniref:winged helix-turn-helix domain-containing protein n=1 Tax=unclassified Novosphingobium TaxID=2644732 RepID=UPI0006C8B60D|nr:MULTISPECIES: response regulator transcription factor [unclassified Novosphingobium]